MPEIIYHPEAEAEMIESAKFYEKRVQGLGVQFLVEIDQAIEVIRSAPDR